MAYGMIYSINGTLDQYDAVIDDLQLNGKAAPGGIFHWVGETETGLRIADIWESKTAFEKFMGEKLAPTLQKLGVAAPENVEEFSVHNFLAQ